MTRRWRAKGTTAATGLAGAGLLAVLSGRPWVTGSVATALAPELATSATGAESSRAVLGVALAGGAAVLVAVTGRRVVRVVAGVLAALCGGAAGILTALVLARPADALRTAVVSRQEGIGVLGVDASATAWPWVALVGAVLLVLAGIGAATASAWSGLGPGYEVPAHGAQEAPGSDSGDLWDSLTRGSDPT